VSPALVPNGHPGEETEETRGDLTHGRVHTRGPPRSSDGRLRRPSMRVITALPLFLPIDLPEQLLKLLDEPINLLLLLLTARQPMR